MHPFKADLHIHTILSPCGDLEMSPDAIVAKAVEQNLDIIAITDHNSTRQAKLVKQLAEPLGVRVFCGAEVTTKEEAHVLAIFEEDDSVDQFQLYLDLHLPDIKNDVRKFGYQVAVDENNDIVFEEERLLISALDQTVEEIEKKVHELNGLFIPAHVDKFKFSIIQQLGFLPFDLKVDAIELSPRTMAEDYKLQNSYLKNHTFINNSDAHFLEQIGTSFTYFYMMHRNLSEMKLALANQQDRFVLNKPFCDKINR